MKRERSVTRCGASALALAGLAAVSIAAVSSCGLDDDAPLAARSTAPTAPPDEPETPPPPSLDAARQPSESQPAPASSSGEPDYHLDPDPVSSAPLARPRARRARNVELVLRSTPAGAAAAVDGQPIGKTPTFWIGTTDGRPREFTFALPGYAVARYRFVPATNGVVHATLRQLVTLPPDGGPAQP